MNKIAVMWGFNVSNTMLRIGEGTGKTLRSIWISMSDST